MKSRGIEMHPRLLILRYLHKKPHSTAVKMAEELGYASEFIYKKLRELHKEGKIYVSDWMTEQHTGNPSKKWAIKYTKNLRDEPKPPRKTDAERAREYQRRKRWAKKFPGVVFPGVATARAKVNLRLLVSPAFVHHPSPPQSVDRMENELG